jgi:hypothetical protein
MNARETIGAGLGWLSAPVFGAIALARHARVLHPEGLVLSARVDPIATAPDLQKIATLLAGPALVRLSTALWRKGKEWPDALGCAIRFRDDPRPSSEPAILDQDLLFATVRTPVATPFAPLHTDVTDFFANTLYATSPFEVPGVGRSKWRLVPEQTTARGDSRAARLADAVARGEASFRIELRRTWHRGYAPVARLSLLAFADVDQDRLRFSPFRAGRGVVPSGFVHALRRGAYVGSQRLGHPTRT